MMPMPQDPGDEPDWCERCGEVRVRMHYRLTSGGQSSVWICERCDDAPEEQDECDHEWVYTGTAYGGDDASYHGEGLCYCTKCGADGDA